MAEAFRPIRGGYIHAFGATWFITEFLKGTRPMETPRIDPGKGAPQADIHSAYKLALHNSIAEDLAARDEESAIEAGKPLTIEEADLRRNYYLSRIPSRLTRMRYSSFCTYFSRLIQLGWVERTGEEEPSIPQENWPDARPRVFYRLTPEAMAREVPQVFDPIMLLHPEYTREKRSGKKHLYFATVPARRLPPKLTPPPAPAPKPARVIAPPKKAPAKPAPPKKAPTRAPMPPKAPPAPKKAPAPPPPRRRTPAPEPKSAAEAALGTYEGGKWYPPEPAESRPRRAARKPRTPPARR